VRSSRLRRRFRPGGARPPTQVRRRADLRSAVGARHQDRAVHLPRPGETPITLPELAEAYLPKISPATKTYLSVRSEADSSRAEQAPRDEATYREIGRFLTRWVELERLVQELLPERFKQRPLAMPVTIRILAGEQLLDSEMLHELDRLSHRRNQLVHGIEAPHPPYLAEATERLAVLISEIKQLRGSQGKCDGPGRGRSTGPDIQAPFVTRAPYPRLVPNACRFCGATDRKITKEHVWPEWLADFLPRPRSLAHAERWSSTSRRQAFRQPFLSATVKAFCDECNNGWVAELEAVAKPIIGFVRLSAGQCSRQMWASRRTAHAPTR
jgi:hypothetical protein